MQKVLITGARSGIINKVCDKLITKNYFLYITVHTNSELKIIEKKYNKYNNVKCFKLDVTSKEDKKILENLDVDILISNAAIAESGSVSEIDINKIRNNFEVNVFANFEILQIILKKMMKKKKGKIIMMSSLAGIIPIPFLGSYCATKASIIKLAECLNLELKLLDNNIKISIITPGLYKTGFNKLAFDKKYDFMDIDSYFKHQLNIIRKSENIFLTLFEKKNLNSIVNKIVKAVESANPHLFYRTPFSQVLFAKIMSLIV